MEKVHELCNESSAAVFVALQDWDLVVRTAAMEEFERGRSFLICAFAVRLDHCTQMPFRMFAIGDFLDKDNARKACSEVLGTTFDHPKIRAVQNGPMRA